MTAPPTQLSAVLLVGSLKSSSEPSSSELLGTQVLDAMKPHGVTGTVVRLADHDIKPGVELDMGPGDAWPTIREQILGADVLVLATPIWMGQPSSVTKRALERLDAELSEADDEGRLRTFGRVAVVAVVGNEDGAHHVCAELFQALNDVGFTIPAGGGTYWVGRAMETVDYKDLDETPEKVAATTTTLAANAAHLARLLKSQPYPPA
ncbi:flavodoxin family protein [Cellulomonas fimi]|uniref:Flavodoxin family protein n=1 Tax=Cellulomonas fimi TaxID=1708 RepID=A0A7Y0LYD2_CELFI|nr:NAD(P)H-dependent oxidoreductase [Cellulomonas fimi]NMR20199.1 flavodoxin family protein [Cellulomonas fimi]